MTQQKHYHLEITGGIWWPMGAKAATTRDFTAESDKDAIAHVNTEAGDFSSVDDFRLERVSGWRVNTKPTKKSPGAWRYVEEHKIVRDWQSEDGELQFQDAMYPSEE